MGVDSQTKLTHWAVAPAVSRRQILALCRICCTARRRGCLSIKLYRGQSEVLREHAPHAQANDDQRYRDKDRIDEVEREKNRTKVQSADPKVEHVFAGTNLKLGFVKVRYRGLDKNAHRLLRDLRAGESVPVGKATVLRYGGVLHRTKELNCPREGQPKGYASRGEPKPPVIPGLCSSLR